LFSRSKAAAPIPNEMPYKATKILAHHDKKHSNRL
jgi:hypothetical protein